MATDGPPGIEPNPPDLGGALAALNTWSNPELQAKLSEIGAPNMGPREELMDRLKGYVMQTGMMPSKPNLQSMDDKPTPLPQIPTLPPMPPIPAMPLPPGMGMLQAMSMMGGVPPPGLRLPMDGPGLPPGLTQEDQLKMVQQRAAMVLQQEERSKQDDPRSMEHMKEQHLLEQQKRAAVMMEHERQQELVKMQVGGPPPRGPEPGLRPPGMPMTPLGAMRGMVPGVPPPPGISMVTPPSHRQRVPPPPGEDAREVWQGEEVGMGPKIPQALEKILQLKEIRQEQLSIAPVEDDDSIEMELRNSAAAALSEADDEDTGLSKKDKNRKRRNRKKKNKKKRAQEKRALDKDAGEAENEKEKEKEKDPEVEIEYVTEEPDIYDPNFIFFKRIFESFKLTDDVKKEKEKEPEKAEKQEATAVKKKGFEEEKKDSDDSDEETKTDAPKMSKKKLRRMNRLTVAELKQLVARPDVVEMHDVTAQEPKLLVHLKATRNTVPVPRHWCFKRKYLQGKRGIEKPPFELPEFIKRTGIQEMREALQEKEDAKTMKTKMREKVRPKMGKIDIDYQKLHDAFFNGLITPGGFSSVPAGMETPELIELRKKKIEEAMDGNETPQLFTVLPERRTASVGAAMMASTHIYDVSGAIAGRKAGGGQESQGVEVALAPEELELDPMAMTQKYEEHVREQQAQVEKEDFSDMVAEHAAKQKQKKRKAAPQDNRGGAKKYKEFKF
ncbi:hypothetical protein COCON_G00079340 [Conger conger]|uniref:SAP domain-containing protein n=1 Tax=Conger conger TaxID=82655 RepID=A0A9Q1DP97_CONCO|nr:hypothetical protein COCON_G00079340 [Conger conger]